MLKILIIFTLMTPKEVITKQKCEEYNSKFMVLLHKSLELECEKQPGKYYSSCTKILRQITKYNWLRSKYCYEDVI
jgi:hypothetical protein